MTQILIFVNTLQSKRGKIDKIEEFRQNRSDLIYSDILEMESRFADWSL